MQMAHCCPVMSERPAAVLELGWEHPARSTTPIGPPIKANGTRLALFIFAPPRAASSGAGADQGKFDAAVLGPPLRRVVWGDRVGIAEAPSLHQVRVYALRDQEIGDG